MHPKRKISQNKIFFQKATLNPLTSMAEIVKIIFRKMKGAAVNAEKRDKNRF
jgi:hypothetical protein